MMKVCDGRFDMPGAACSIAGNLISVDRRSWPRSLRSSVVRRYRGKEAGTGSRSGEARRGAKNWGRVYARVLQYEGEWAPRRSP